MRRTHEAEAGKTWTHCKSEFEARQLILSDAFLARFDLLLRCLPTPYDQDDPPVIAERSAKCFRAAHQDLFSIARHEVNKPPSNRHPRLRRRHSRGRSAPDSETASR